MSTDPILLAVRLMMATMFCSSGIPKLLANPGELHAIAGLGLPVPGALEVLAGACQIAGAAMLAFGAGTRIAAALLAVFVVVVTPLFLHFGSVVDAVQRAQMSRAFFTIFGVVAGCCRWSPRGQARGPSRLSRSAVSGRRRWRSLTACRVPRCCARTPCGCSLDRSRFRTLARWREELGR